jgi:hypothetical protein
MCSAQSHKTVQSRILLNCAIHAATPQLCCACSTPAKDAPAHAVSRGSQHTADLEGMDLENMHSIFTQVLALHHSLHTKQRACALQEPSCMHESATHVPVQHGVDVLLVVALDSWGGEEEVGVGCGIAPLQVVDLGISGVPLVTQGQNQPHSRVLCSVDNVVQGLEDCLIVDTCKLQNKHDGEQCGRYYNAHLSGTCRALKTTVHTACTVLTLQTCICALGAKIQATVVWLRNKLGTETAARQCSPC